MEKQKLLKSTGSIKRTLVISICKKCLRELKTKFRIKAWNSNMHVCPVTDPSEFLSREERAKLNLITPLAPSGCYGHCDPDDKWCKLDINIKLCKIATMKIRIGKDIVIPHNCPYEVEHILSKN